MKLLLCAIAGYLLGSISVSILVTKYIFHDDLRQQGSGNAGATNAARVYGLGAGVLTFAGDFAKSILAMLLGRGLGGVTGLAVGGAACLLGHCFPIYFKFKGGKAVSAGRQRRRRTGGHQFRPHVAFDDERPAIRPRDLPQYRRRHPLRALHDRPHRRSGILVEGDGAALTRGGQCRKRAELSR